MLQEDLGQKEVRFSGTADGALDLFGQLYKYWTTPPHNYSNTRQFLSPRIGSPKFRQVHLAVRDPVMVACLESFLVLHNNYGRFNVGNYSNVTRFGMIC